MWRSKPTRCPIVAVKLGLFSTPLQLENILIQPSTGPSPPPRQCSSAARCFLSVEATARCSVESVKLGLFPSTPLRFSICRLLLAASMTGPRALSTKFRLQLYLLNNALGLRIIDRSFKYMLCTISLNLQTREKGAFPIDGKQSRFCLGLFSLATLPNGSPSIFISAHYTLAIMDISNEHSEDGYKSGEHQQPEGFVRYPTVGVTKAAAVARIYRERLDATLLVPAVRPPEILQHDGYLPGEFSAIPKTNLFYLVHHLPPY